MCELVLQIKITPMHLHYVGTFKRSTALLNSHLIAAFTGFEKKSLLPLNPDLLGPQIGQVHFCGTSPNTFFSSG